MVKKDTLATFRIEEELWDKFKARAAENRYSASALLLQYVEDYATGRIPSTPLDNSKIDIDRYLDERIDSLEKRIDGRIDAIKTELEAKLEGLPNSIAKLTTQAENKPGKSDILSPAPADNNQDFPELLDRFEPIGTQELCERLGVSFSNLSTRGKRHDRSPEEQLSAEARERGQEWRVCDRTGRVLLWERVG